MEEGNQIHIFSTASGVEGRHSQNLALVLPCKTGKSNGLLSGFKCVGNQLGVVALILAR